ncbi:ABC transporter substrate-binding protein [Streptomyces hainanensis]|uniref:Extracellular solute-binding protein n=1 Tax=Streptomyces hainanensis TaxID=402648 RepID=A0A4R4T6N2_9ACTN|nr:ABC transporter substrate-binding protein [Streptomyces hainanensis]TDC72577.1 extracellular solute-binding protein [Streptomyces hainanensis]
MRARESGPRHSALVRKEHKEYKEHVLGTTIRGTRTRGSVLCVITVLLAAACGSGDGSASVAPREVGPARGSLTWYAINFGPDGLPQRLVDAFEEEHPDISVTYQAAPNNTDTMRATLTTEISGGSGAIDVYSGDVVWPAQFGDAQLAMPLDAHLPDDFWDRFPRERVDVTLHDGDHLGAPLYVDTGFLFYRQDLLEKHDLPVPKTWEELADTGEKLQRAGDVRYGYVAQWANYEGLTVNWTELSAAAGGRSVTEDGQAGIDSPENRRVLDFMRGMLTDRVVPAAMTSFQEQQSLQTFVEGDAAFHRNWSYAWGEANNPETSRIAGKIGMSPMPAFEGEDRPGPSGTGGWNLMINPHSDAIGAGLEFIRWMTGPTAQRMLAENSVLPAVSEVLNDQELQRDNPPLAAAATVPLVSRPSDSPRYAQVSNGIFTNINGSLAGSVPPKEALSAAQHDIGKALKGRAL